MRTTHLRGWILLSAATTLLLAGCDISKLPGSIDKAQPAATADAKTGCALAADSYNTLANGGADKETKGAFTEPFCEEKFLSDYPDADIPERGAGTVGVTNPLPVPYQNLEHCARRSEDKFYECKPAAGSIALLPDDRLVYFNALENTENAEFNAFKEAGDITVNDQSRVLQLGANGVANWSRPSHNDAGASNPVIQPGAGQHYPFVGNVNIGVTPDDAANNDGALFCAHLVNLYDGRVLAAGGTDYYTELGLVELEGLKSTRIFDPKTNDWTQADPMSWGRWYPTMTTLVNGNIFVASGVRKLIKPVYLDRPQDSARNETHTEIFQAGCNEGRGRWSDNGAAGQKSLPLFPRLHLLPNNQVFYAAAGQSFNPLGQSYDEALWNFASAYDPATNTWTNLGIPGLNSILPGFRGSTSNIMMPLVPDADGKYNKAEFLTMGGVYLLSPGSYVAFAQSRMDTADLSGGGMDLSSRNTGSLNQSRWYGQGVLLPTGQVMLFSGADLDEVVLPGTEAPRMEPEMFDPATETWSVMAKQGHARTYHNSALLLPDGRVLVGGHSPIPFGYAVFVDVPLRAPQGRDPTFEIYSPPYMFKPRPVISSLSASSAAPGASLTINTPDAAAVAKDGYVVLVRRTAITHLVDGDQRNVVLRITGSNASSLTVQLPDNDAAQNQAVIPPGHYLVFVVKKNGAELAPSVSANLLISGADLGCH